MCLKDGGRGKEAAVCGLSRVARAMLCRALQPVPGTSDLTLSERSHGRILSRVVCSDAPFCKFQLEVKGAMGSGQNHDIF